MCSRASLSASSAATAPNTFIDSSTVAGQRHSTRWYDAGTVAGISYAPDTLFDRRPWEAQSGELTPPGIDFGTKYTPFVGFSSHRGVGITPRFGVAKYTYGFDRRPYESMVKLEGEYAATFRGARVTASADRRLESSPIHFTALARLSDLEVVNFNGFGNLAADSGSANPYFAVHQRQWMFRPAIAIAIGSTTDISLGPVIQHSVSDSARSPYLAGGASVRVRLFHPSRHAPRCEIRVAGGARSPKSTRITEY